MNKAQKIIVFLIFILLACVLMLSAPDCKISTSNENRLECYSAYFFDRAYYFLAISAPLFGLYFLLKPKK